MSITSKTVQKSDFPFSFSILPFLWLPFCPTYLLISPPFLYCMHLLHVCVYMLACISVDMHMPQPTPVHQETALGSSSLLCHVGPKGQIQVVSCKSRHRDLPDEPSCQPESEFSISLVTPPHPTPMPSAASSSLFLWFCGEQWTDRASALLCLLLL